MRQGSRQFLPCRNRHVQPPLILEASLRQLWVGRGLDWAFKAHVIMHPSVQVAKRKTQRRIRSDRQSASWWNLLAAPGLPLWRAGGVNDSLPLNGVLGFSLRQQFGQNAPYFAVFAQGYLRGKDARDEGLIYAQRSTIHLNPSKNGLEYF